MNIVNIVQRQAGSSVPAAHAKIGKTSSKVDAQLIGKTIRLALRRILGKMSMPCCLHVGPSTCADWAMMHSRLRHAVAPVVILLVTLFGASPAPVEAQEIDDVSIGALNQDLSELAPAPSTWKGAITDSLRLLTIEHTLRVAFQNKTRRELGRRAWIHGHGRCVGPASHDSDRVVD